ncbi:mitochondrial dicarboxylate carrier isoform X2 [Bombus huntii]|uniref:mitochondrial dicarboxylate carrier isoform X2 n=1 Tax=Bombus huntii TaxID=85661 RepID=UPI0021AAEA42|nr:mitochondrial dicarboxylate carrier isoform X2 [Bombus huntii]
MTDKTKKVSRWYFGGLSSAGAACVTHPLDLLKVHLQTQQEGKLSIARLTTSIIQNQGILALYNGLSASLLRQLTYSTMRFGAYEVGKQTFETSGQSLLFYQKLLLAGFSGAAGGILGTPGDVINVRMQNDIKLPPQLRRNYKHALDGIIRVIQQEGVSHLFSGCSTATLRAALMTIGQLSFYDQVKIMLLQSGYFKDNPITHVVSSVCAGAVATTLTQPLDVLKTRAMNANPGEFKLGPFAFFKGYVPAFIRLAPQTILTFVLLEQLRSNFGFYPSGISVS